MADTINVGDVVSLKSFSWFDINDINEPPIMTVEYVSEIGKCTCVWFYASRLIRDTFPSEALEKVLGQ